MSQQMAVPGVYVLILRLEEEATLSVGSLGVSIYASGWYGYVGSALGGLIGRLRHHLSIPKRHHWHIDYLLQLARVTAIVAIPTHRPLECSLAAFLGSRFPVVPHFGSSDCQCVGHLFYSQHGVALMRLALDAPHFLACPRQTASSSLAEEPDR